MIDHSDRLFCGHGSVVTETECFYIIRDAYPANEGHLLTVLKWHEPSFLEITEHDWIDLCRTVQRARELLAMAGIP